MLFLSLILGSEADAHLLATRGCVSSALPPYVSIRHRPAEYIESPIAIL
jgi:hypothetical protein